MDRQSIALFALHESRPFAERVATRLGMALSEHEEQEFEDGEHKTRAIVSVRGKDVFAVQSLYMDKRQSANDKLCRMLFFLGALRDAAAARVTAVIPYLAYARKDCRTEPRDPVTTRYVAAAIESVGTDGVITMDVHNLAAYQNAFRCLADHLEASTLFVDYFAALIHADDAVSVVSPDSGGMKRAEGFRSALSAALGREVPIAFMQKARGKDALKVGRLVGDVADTTAIIIDDLISTGGTVLGAARACRDAGATRVYAAVTHGIFAGRAGEVVADEAIDKVVVTDTVPPVRLDPVLVKDRLEILSASALFADAIKSMHESRSFADWNR